MIYRSSLWLDFKNKQTNSNNFFQTKCRDSTAIKEPGKINQRKIQNIFRANDCIYTISDKLYSHIYRFTDFMLLCLACLKYTLHI